MTLMTYGRNSEIFTENFGKIKNEHLLKVS